MLVAAEPATAPAAEKPKVSYEDGLRAQLTRDELAR